jgi:UDP:flavonoid glycosyltransferase YjiC (YdhE family)
MKITVIAVGTRGDVQPLIALASGLHRAGHTVRFATEAIFADVLRKAGLEFYQLSGDSERFHAGPAGVAFRESLDRSPFHFRRFWKAFVAIGFRKHLREIVEPCRDAEAIVCLPYLNIGATLAELLGVPCFVAGMIPVPAFPTGEFPYPFFSGAKPNMASDANLRTWRRALPLMRISDDSVQEWRDQTLGLPRQSFVESYQATRRLPHLFGFSQVLVPKPQNWDEDQSITGFWHLPPSTTFTAPTDLQEFLDAGEAPVLVGFGSHVGREPQRLTKLVAEALASAGRRGILVTGWGALKNVDLGKSVFSTPGVPYDWLLPRVSAAVHHGGSGTIGACLRAGVPQIVTPFGYDQTFWGHRIAALGLGSNPIQARTMTAIELASAIELVTGSDTIRSQACRVGIQVSAEDGVATAVKAIEAYLARRTVTRASMNSELTAP